MHVWFACFGRCNFPIVYGPKTVFYDLPNGTDRRLVVSNRISLRVLDMTDLPRLKFLPLLTKRELWADSSFSFFSFRFTLFFYQ